MTRVAVTGFGVVTACGAGRAPLGTALASGHSPVRAMELFDVSTCRSRTAAQVAPLERPDGALSPREWKRMERAGQMLLVAAREALGEAGLHGSGVEAPVVMATTGGGMRAAEYFHRALLSGGGDRRNAMWLANYLPHRQSQDLQKQSHARGPILTLANACASSANAIGYAVQMIRHGRTDVAITGGYDALAELIFAGFDSILAATPTRCRPFDAARDGMVLGEGAAVLVLESFDRARGRGVEVLAEVRGYGESIDILHMTQPNPEATGAFSSMRMACRSAGISPETVDYINAHGTATPQNDSMESLAIRRLMPERGAEVYVGSTKPITGHTLGAAGAVEAVIAILALQQQLVPPNLHFETADPSCAVRVPDAPVGMPLKTILSNSFGFGGLNASLVLGLP
jgi:3-oxoacyl-[acyl-carrier-protein] synthase II